MILAVVSAVGQIRLAGARSSPAGGIDIVTWDALDPLSAASYPSMLQAYLLTSSGFDAYNGNYYLTGITASVSGLYSFNTTTQAQAIVPFSGFSNIAEFDMSTGRYYTLESDTAGIIRILVYDTGTGADSLLATVTEPGLDGLVVDAIGFDSNNGILYYIGPDGNQVLTLFGFHVRATPFFHTKLALSAPAPVNSLTGLNYDNVHDRLFARNTEMDGAGTFIRNTVVEVLPSSGAVNTLAEIAGYTGYLVGSSSFDQYSGSMVMVAVDSSFQFDLVIFHTADNTLSTGFVPDYVSEIVCDNTSFAQSFYLTGQKDAGSVSQIRIYPNPAGSEAVIESLSDDFQPGIINVNDAGGALIRSVRWNSMEKLRLDVSSYPDGIYFLEFIAGDRKEVRKLIVR